MKFKELKWEDRMEDGVVTWSTCDINICGMFTIEFRVNYDFRDERFYLYAFGKGKIRRLTPEPCDSIEHGKSMAYKIYNDEMIRIKKTIDCLVEDDV